MNGIRGKLFLNIGVILTVVALLNFFVPRFFVEKDINAASIELSEKFIESQKSIQLAFARLVSERFISRVTDLESLTRLLSQQNFVIEQKNTLQEKGAEILQYAPNLAYIQISDKDNTVVFTPENATMFIPEWARINEKTLAIRLPNHPLFIAKLPPVATESQRAYYLLYPADDSLNIQDLKFKSFRNSPPTFTPGDGPTRLYDYVAWQQNQLIDKAKMIQILVAKPDRSVGMLSANSTFEEGYALLAKSAFSVKPKINKSLPPNSSHFLLREEAGMYYLDFVHYLLLNDLKIALGFSLSKVATQTTQILHKPLLISTEGSKKILFFPGKSPVVLQDESFNQNHLIYNGEIYHVDPHNIGKLTFSVLTPIDQMTSVGKLMAHLRDELTKKISFNLLLITAIVFIFALFLLARMSKKMTRPISQLAQAAEEIGQGHYKNLILPNIEKRKNEIATLTHSFQGMITALRDREKIQAALNKVVSKEVAAEILKSNVELGGEERTVTLLFSDIRNFTPLSNLFTPKEVIQILNKYMTRMCRIIDLTNGVVDKFVGDEIMALYGAPLSMHNQADRALEAATGMMNELKEWNILQTQKEERPLEIGIGVHTGPVYTGNMGAENRLNYTAIGANVNFASRMCAAARPMQILVSESTIKALENPEKFNFQPIAAIQLKGFDEPVSLFEVV